MSSFSGGFSKGSRGGFTTEEEGAPTRLNLTALMDILSNIIFFLMASFGAQTLDMASAQQVELPSSTSELSLKMSVAVAVGMETLFVEDEPVAKLSQGKLEVGSDQTVASLDRALRRVRAERLAKNERKRDADDVVLFVADKRLEYETIEPVMQTCARVGFTKFRFAVAKY